MEDSQARDVSISAKSRGQEVRIADQCFDKTNLGFPCLGTLRTQGGCGVGATKPPSFQPGEFSSLNHSLYGSHTVAGGRRD